MAGIKARSGPPGNGNALKNGVWALDRMMKEGTLDGRTSLARWKARRIAEYVNALGGADVVSPQEGGIIEDTVDAEIIAGRARDELFGIKRLYRKGKVHPLVEVFLKAIAQCREGRKTLGTKRRQKELSLEDYAERKYGNKSR